MKEHSVHAPHHSHVRKAIDALHVHHAALQASHTEAAAAETARRAAQLDVRTITASPEAAQ